MAGKDTYIIRVQGTLVEVTEDVYRVYYGMERHLLTLNETAILHTRNIMENPTGHGPQEPRPGQ